MDKLKKEQFVQLLKMGNTLSGAAEGIGVDRDTVLDERRRDKRFDAKVKDARYNYQVYLVEDALYTEAIKGNVTAQIFFLKNRAPDRWGDRVDFSGGMKVEHEISFAKDPKLRQMAEEVYRKYVLAKEQSGGVRQANEPGPLEDKETPLDGSGETPSS
jgi:hypothetical protein